MDDPPNPAEPTEPAPEKRPPPTAAEERGSYFRWACFWLVLILWFGYDGWYNQDEKMMKHRAFNRSCTYLFVGACALCLGQSLRYHIVARRTPTDQAQTPSSGGS